LKKWLTNSALIAGGAGVGTAVAMVGDKLLGAKLGPIWQRLDPKAKKYIIGPLLGAAMVCSGLAAQKLMMERSKKDRE
jgi:hypothetical protein